MWEGASSRLRVCAQFSAGWCDVGLDQPQHRHRPDFCRDGGSRLLPPRDTGRVSKAQGPTMCPESRCVKDATATVFLFFL